MKILKPVATFGSLIGATLLAVYVFNQQDAPLEHEASTISKSSSIHPSSNQASFSEPRSSNLEGMSEKEQLLFWNSRPLDEEANTAYLVLYEHWVKTDPAEAAENLDLVPAAMHMALLGPIASAWAKVDPQKAMAWAEERTHPGHRYQAAQSAISSWATEQPLEAYAWAAENMEEEGVDSAFTAWCRAHPESASEALLAVPVASDDSAFYEFLRLATDALFVNSPNQAVRLIEKAGFPADEYDRFHSALYRWKASAPEEAALWLDSNQDHPLRIKTLDD